MRFTSYRTEKPSTKNQPKVNNGKNDINEMDLAPISRTVESSDSSLIGIKSLETGGRLGRFRTLSAPCAPTGRRFARLHSDSCFHQSTAMVNICAASNSYVYGIRYKLIYEIRQRDF